MKDTRLYIDDVLVDLDNESIITMNYLLEDSDNPTIVKNSFSKSITLPSTEGNNALFGRIYDLSRETIIDEEKHSGIYFNTLKRTPFKMFVDGTLVESGYIQLTDISTLRGVPRYTIQCFGGLGDFLYSLMYDENGDKRNLASLHFGFDGYNGDSANEMDFNITKEHIQTSWNNLGADGYYVGEHLTFVPAYNGVSKDFDANKALVNIYNNNIGLPTTITEGGTTYRAVNGYALAEFKRALDETEVRDMRSYLQRPALSVKALFTACCKPENNGGYRVNLDKSFFNEENTLYDDAYITLPMLSNETETTIGTQALDEATDFVGGGVNRFSKDIELGTFSIADAPTNATIKVDVPFSLRVEDGAGEAPRYSRLYFSCKEYERVYQDMMESLVLKTTYNSGVVVQLRLYDGKSGSLLTASQELAMVGDREFKRTWKVYSPLDGIARGITNIRGELVRHDSGNRMEFVSQSDSNTFPMSAKFNKGNVSHVRVVVNIQRVYEQNIANISTDASALFDNKSAIDTSISESVVRNNLLAGIASGELAVDTTNLPSVSSGTKITKEMLLGSTASPAEYLLSYCKLFGLRFIKDVHTKTITITSQYFTGEVVNINERIDRGQAMNITPNVFNKKFMRMSLEQPESYLSKKYKDANKLDYAQKRVDTGFSFNTETEEIYKDNIFTSAVPCLAVSRYYNSYYNSKGVEVFAPMAEDITMHYANGTLDTGFKLSSQTIASRTYIEPSKTIPFSANKGYDLMPRMCYFRQNNDESREGIDISNNLVIYCGKHDLLNSAGEAVTYYLTDDLAIMGALNGGKNCYILTQSETSANGDRIAIAYTKLPLFLSVRLINNIVYSSFDFAKSKESYIPNINYPEGATLYERYWRDFYEDRMHVDTRKVSCYVDLSGMEINGEALRKFYFFDNNVWLLNKVEDYDPTTDRLTKCEFIKVRNMSAYLTPVDGVDTDGGDSSFDYSFEIKLS